MYHRILLPVDLADPDLAKPALETAVMLAKATDGDIRLINVLPVTPVMLAEYVPADFESSSGARRRKRSRSSPANCSSRPAR